MIQAKKLNVRDPIDNRITDRTFEKIVEHNTQGVIIDHGDRRYFVPWANIRSLEIAPPLIGQQKQPPAKSEKPEKNKSDVKHERQVKKPVFQKTDAPKEKSKTSRRRSTR